MVIIVQQMNIHRQQFSIEDWLVCQIIGPCKLCNLNTVRQYNL